MQSGTERSWLLFVLFLRARLPIYMIYFVHMQLVAVIQEFRVMSCPQMFDYYFIQGSVFKNRDSTRCV